MTTIDNNALSALHRIWHHEADWMVCQGCKRPIIASRDGEELAHRDGCRHAAEQHPWSQLRAILGAAPAKKAAPVAKVKADYPPAFLAAFDAGRKWRAGSTLPAAFNAWKARIAAGADPDAIIAGTKAYAAYCLATGSEKKMAQTFFGPGEHFTAEWAVPAPAARGAQASPKFNFANADRSGDRRAQAATMARHGIVVPEGEVEL